MEALVAERERKGPFTDLADFARRVEARQINRRQLENLTRAGAFDGLEPNRRRVFEGIDRLLSLAGTASDERASGQMGLFGAGGKGSGGDLALPETEDWPPMERLRQEFEAIGFYLSAHPLDAYGRALRRLRVTSAADVIARRQSGPVNLAGTVIAKKERTSGKGSRFAFVQLSDTTGVFEVTVFSELLTQHRDLLVVGASLFLRAIAQAEGDAVRFTVQAIEPLEAAFEHADAEVVLRVGSAAPLDSMKSLLGDAGTGRTRITVVAVVNGHGEVEITLSGRYAVPPETLLRFRTLPGVLDIREG